MRKNVALILVDMQDFFLKNFSPVIKRNLITRQGYVIDLCIRKNVPLIVLEYKAGGIDRGKTTPALEQKIRKAKQEIIIKENNSGFTKTTLHEILKGLGIKEIVLMGVNANGCVQDTAIGALHRGYKVVTCLETMASASRKDAELSKRNRDWFRSNTTLLESSENLIAYINKF